MRLSVLARWLSPCYGWLVLVSSPYSPELNPVEKLGDLVIDAICNKLFTALRPLEDAILAELEPLRRNAERVAALIGEGWLLEQANAGETT